MNGTPPRWHMSTLARVELREETTAALELTLGLVMLENGFEPSGMHTTEGEILAAPGLKAPPGWVYLIAQALGSEVETQVEQDDFDVEVDEDSPDPNYYPGHLGDPR
jgi:hypothetical protein